MKLTTGKLYLLVILTCWALLAADIFLRQSGKSQRGLLVRGGFMELYFGTGVHVERVAQAVAACV